MVGSIPDARTDATTQLIDDHQYALLADAYLLDVYLFHVASGKATNLTSIDRVSHYNSGLFYW